MEMKPKSVDPAENPVKLVDAKALLEALFEEGSSRPSIRWLREQQRARSIPFIRIGRLVRFDVQEVRRALSENWTIKRSR